MPYNGICYTCAGARSPNRRLRAIPYNGICYTCAGGRSPNRRLRAMPYNEFCYTCAGGRFPISGSRTRETCCRSVCAHHRKLGKEPARCRPHSRRPAMSR